jgi:alanine dehydrogenase
MEAGAGEGAGFTDTEYAAAGAKLLPLAAQVYEKCDMIVKVKEPLPSEYSLFKDGQILYTYLHLAPNPGLTMALLEHNIRGMAYETIEDVNHSLPCLKPMSEIAGRLSIQEGAKYLEKPFGGRGILLAGVPGVEKGKITIVGGGVVGTNACKVALGMGAQVTILDKNLNRLEYLDDIFGGMVKTLYSNATNLEEAITEADLVIGSVLIPGASAPKLIKREYLKHMKKAAVIVDVAVDQGGCCETTHATTHQDPIFDVDGVIHYCVANMPGAVPRTSTLALTNTTLSYGLQIAELGVEEACRRNHGLARGMNVYKGACTYEGVSQALGIPYTPIEKVLG